MAYQAGGFIWYELMTTDADAAQRFYSEVVGWRIADSGMPNTDYRMLHAADIPVSGLMQLSEDMLAGGAHPVWLGYIAVDDVDATVASAIAAGGQVMVPATDIPDVGRFTMIADPQGVPIYVMRGTSDEPSGAASRTQEGHCAWNELATPDPKAAVQFYMKHFGWNKGETMPMGIMGDYQMVNLNDAPVAGIMKSDPAGAPPMWRFYFRVPNLKQAMEKIAAGGGTVLNGPQAVPGDDEILIGKDPQGAMFALVAKR